MPVWKGWVLHHRRSIWTAQLSLPLLCWISALFGNESEGRTLRNSAIHERWFLYSAPSRFFQFELEDGNDWELKSEQKSSIQKVCNLLPYVCGHRASFQQVRLYQQRMYPQFRCFQIPTIQPICHYECAQEKLVWTWIRPWAFCWRYTLWFVTLTLAQDVQSVWFKNNGESAHWWFINPSCGTNSNHLGWGVMISNALEPVKTKCTKSSLPK